MYKHHTRVTASQTGIDGYQTLVSIVTLMQDCSQMGLDNETLLAQYFKENKLTFMIVSRQVDIIRYPVYGESLEVMTAIYDCKPAMGFRNTFLNDAEGNTVAKSWSLGAVVSLENGKLSRIPAWLIDSFVYDPELKMERLGRRIDLPDTKPRRLAAYPVQKSDIDFNKHVNNVQYIRMASEHLPEGFDCKRLRVEYKNQAKFGDTIVSQAHELVNNTLFIQLTREDESPYALLEFS